MKISGAGCCLLDYIYTDYSFASGTFKKLQSEKPGDGGLIPGGLVFTDQLARFAGMSEENVMTYLTGGKDADAVNVGGPGVIAMIHAAQMLDPALWEITFFGVCNSSPGFSELYGFLDRIPLPYIPIQTPGDVPSTTVLSDPSYHEGAGERTFVNNLGAANLIDPDQIHPDFFDADLFIWGGTALVPPLHDRLTDLLKISSRNGKVNIVGTVYDFRNEQAAPEKSWPLGTRDEPAYPYIDLLITDEEEAFRLSGAQDLEGAADFFRTSGAGAFIITRGKKDLFLSAGKDSIFKSCSGIFLPVSPYVNEDLKTNPDKRGDTTGCGDNFMGGVLVSIARQMSQDPHGFIDPVAAAVEGICAGGLALYTRGGCMIEEFPGEKSGKIDAIREHYLKHTLPGLNPAEQGIL